MIETDEALALCQQVGGPLWVGLDAHKSSCTAAAFDDRGESVATWKFPTHRAELVRFADRLPPLAEVAVEASTTGKAVVRLLRDARVRVHMANPVEMGKKPAVKTDERDAIRLARRLQVHDLPEAYVPPVEYEAIRDLVRFRMRLGRQVAAVKQRIHALVSRNLLDEKMHEFSDWFGVGGLEAMATLPLSDRDRAFLDTHLRQLAQIVAEEEWVEGEMARRAKGNPGVELLMTIPGLNFYSALAIIGEIGEIERFPDAKKLASYAGLVPRADNSGDVVSAHRPVKRGNRVLKYFLTCGAMGAVRAKRSNAVGRFYRKLSKHKPGQQAEVAAARKMSAIVYRVLQSGEPYREEDPELTKRKVVRLEGKAEGPKHEVSVVDLQNTVARLREKGEVLERLNEMAPEEEAT